MFGVDNGSINTLAPPIEESSVRAQQREDLLPDDDDTTCRTIFSAYWLLMRRKEAEQHRLFGGTLVYGCVTSLLLYKQKGGR